MTTLTTPPAGFADPHPLVPPLPCCSHYGVCPSRAAACISLPYIPVCDPAETPAAASDVWRLTLYEAINTAINNSEAVRNLGLVEAGSRNDIIRSVITTWDPLIARSEADAQWGIFDPLLTSSIQWNKQDIPPGTSFAGIGARPPELDTADFYTSIEQLLPMGTRVRADLVTNYLFNPDKPPGLDPNPQYFSYTQYSITQPFLQGFGVDVTMAPIKIAAAQAERTDWQFKQEMLALVRSIETTYWALYAQQQNLRAIEQALPAFREVVRMREEQAATVGTQSEVARARSELYLFEQRRLDALNRIAEQQLVLRNLMGLPPDDCRNIALLAVPVTSKPFETLQTAVDVAVSNRPDVLRQRLAVYVAQQERVLADNLVRPRLDGYGYWRTNGLGEDLNESFDVLTANNFNDWQLGVFFQVPLGRRQAQAGLRAAEYRIARERALLQQTAHQASYEVADAYRRINWVYQQLELVSTRQQALAEWQSGARAQFDSPPPGMSTVFALELYLSNLRETVDASTTANALLADYNSALARLSEVKGTLLEERLVTVAGDNTAELPANLPRPEMQLPESVTPAPGASLPPPSAPLATPVPPQPSAVAPAPTIEPPVAEPAPRTEPAPAESTPAPDQGARQWPAYAPAEIARQLPPIDALPEFQPTPPIPPQPLPETAVEPEPALAMPRSIELTPRPLPTPYGTLESDVGLNESPWVFAAPRATLPVDPLEPPIQPSPMPAIELPPSVLPGGPIFDGAITSPRAAETEAPTPMAIAPAAEEPRTASRSRQQTMLRMPHSLPASSARSILKPLPPADDQPMPLPQPTSEGAWPELDLPRSLTPLPAEPPTLADPEPLAAGGWGASRTANLAGAGDASVSLAQPRAVLAAPGGRATPLPAVTPTRTGPALYLPTSAAPAGRSIASSAHPVGALAIDAPTPSRPVAPAAALQLPASVANRGR